MSANLEYTIGLEVQRAVSSLRSFQGALGQLAPAVDKLRGSLQGVERVSSSGGIASMAGGLRALLGPLAAVGVGYEGLRVATDAFKDSINQAASFEQLKVGFTVLLQSGAKAKAMLADLTKFADTTPMQLPELAQAARTLLAFGEPAKDVMKDMRQLGDIAAGVQAPIGEIAELFGKARTEGTLFSIDIRELTRRGIPIIGELAKQFHVSENAIHGMAETGRIKFTDLQLAISNLTSRGGMFFGMLTAQGRTFNGMVSTMRDAWGALQREFGTPILEPLKSGVGEITGILAGWKDRAREWGQTLSNVLKGAMAIIQNGDAGSGLVATLRLGFAVAVNMLYKGATATVATLITGLGAAVNVLFKGLSSGAVWKTIADGLNYVGGKFASVIMRALADVFANIPGMSKVALALNTGANQANKDANVSMEATQKDLQNSDVRKVINDALAAAKTVGEVFQKTYAGTPDQMDTDAPKGTLTGVVNRANDRNNPLPSYVDNEGNPYGPGSPYGSPDSQMPPPGTKPLAADLGAGLRTLLNGARPAAEPDPGEGTIGGVPASAVLGTPGDGTINGSLPGSVIARRPLTLPGPRLSPTLPIPDLNARAQSLVGRDFPRPDPQLATTNTLLSQVVGLLQASQPKPAVAGSGL